MKQLPWLLGQILLIAVFTLPARAATPEYSIQAIRYANSPGDSVADLVMGAPREEKIDTVYVIWLIRGGGRNILFDSGSHVQKWFQYEMTDYVPPDQAVGFAGVKAEEVTDIVISHAHWDHMGGLRFFQKAMVWIQREEFRYYTGESWQNGGNHGGIDPDDAQELVRLNTQGRVRFVDGDNIEIFPGIRAYTGARHTYASQYLLIEGTPRFVLASDNCYLYRNLEEHKASGTFSEADIPANIKNQERMIELAGSPDRVVPGHDALQFRKFATQGRVATIK